MKAEEVRSIARSRQVSLGGLSKANLIRKIQQHEGNFCCFGSASGGDCDQSDCLWRDDCLTESTK